MRLKLLYKLLKLASHAREVELDIQDREQTLYNLKYTNQIYPGTKDKEVAYQEGLVAGIKWSLERFK